MSKDIAKRVAAAAAESAVMSLLPTISETLGELCAETKAMRSEMMAMDGRAVEFRNEVADRFERTQEVINELSHRITRLDGRIEGFMEAVQMGLGPRQAVPRKLKIAKGN